MPWSSGESLSPSILNLRQGEATLATGYSSNTLQAQSGLTVEFLSDISVQNTIAAQRVELGGAPSTTSALASWRANSALSDYLLLQDSSGAKSSYLWGSKTGDGTPSDGLNLYDISHSTMIARFSSDSIRFFAPVVAPVFDTGGALASTYNAALFLPGASKESKIQAAITAAVADGIARVYVPASMYPYSAASVSFSTRVQMVREGGNWAVFDVRAYGAYGDATHDDTAAIQSAISGGGQAGVVGPNQTNQGAVIYVPPGIYLTNSTITINNHNVTLEGVGWSTTASPAAPASLIWGNFAGATISVASGIFSPRFVSLGIQGSSTGDSVGITAPYLPIGILIDRCFFNGYGLSAVSLNGITGWMYNTFAQNCLLASVATSMGVFEIYNTDFVSVGNFATASITPSAGNIGTGRKFAWAVRSSPGMYYGCMGDQSHHGWLVVGAAGNNAFIGCRAYQNQGHGFVVTQGPGNRFIGCTTLANSQTSDNGYSGFSVTGYGNLFIDNFVDGQAGDARQQSNAFNDSNSNGAGDALGNIYSNNRIGLNVRGSLYSMTGTSPYRIDVPYRLSTDRGDTDVTLVAGIDAPTQIFNTALTTRRFISLSNTGAWNGARFRVVRTTAATNPTNQLTSFVGSLDLLPGNWAEYEFGTGLGWQLMGSGSNVTGPSAFANGSILQPSYAWASELSLGWYRSAASQMALSYGQLLLPPGSAVQPTSAFTSEASLGFFRSGVSTLALSYGSFNLNQARLVSVRTAASLDSTSLTTNEMAFQIVAGSVATLAIRSGGTIYYFASSASTKG